MKSSTELQHEAEATRRGLSDTLDGLREAVTPSHVTNEVMALARDTGLSMVKTMADSARANPTAALLIGAGIFMMLTKSNGSGLLRAVASGTAAATDVGRDALASAGGAVKSAAGTGIDALRGAAGAVAQTASDTVHKVADTATATAARVGQAVSRGEASARNKLGEASAAASDALATARQTAYDAKDGVTGTSGQLLQQGQQLAQHGQQTAKAMADKAQKLAVDTRSYVAQLAQDQPITVAALGAAIGAAIAAALPMTETERQYLGSASAKMNKAGRETIAKVADVVKAETIGDNVGVRAGAVADKVVGVVTREITEAIRPAK